MINNIYKTPEAALEVELTTSDEEIVFFPSSNKKLLVLFFSTLGLYCVYWFYKHWAYQNARMDKKILPAIRSVFNIFFTHSLFSRISAAAKAKGIRTNIHFSGLATLYVIAQIASSLIDSASNKTDYVGLLDYASIAILLVVVYPLYAVQKVANQINGDPEGELNSQFSVYNYLFIVLGGIFWLFIIAWFLSIDIAQLWD